MDFQSCVEASEMRHLLETLAEFGNCWHSVVKLLVLETAVVAAVAAAVAGADAAKGGLLGVLMPGAQGWGSWGALSEEKGGSITVI